MIKTTSSSQTFWHDEWAIQNNKLNLDTNQLESLENASSRRSFTTFKKEGIEKFESLRFPASHLEEWRWTSLSRLQSIEFLAHSKISELTKNLATNLVLPSLEKDSDQIVFINGAFSPQFSKIPSDIKCINIRDAFSSHDEIRTLIETFSQQGQSSLSYINQALFQEGLWLDFPENYVSLRPLHCIFISSLGNGEESKENHSADGIYVQPRIFLRVGKNAQVNLCESYRSFDAAGSFEHPQVFNESQTSQSQTSNSSQKKSVWNNPVTHVQLHENSSLVHVRIQDENLQTIHTGECVVNVAKDSHYNSFVMNLGADISRLNLNVKLKGEGSGVTLNGLYLTKEKQHCDHHTTIEHLVPHTSSRQLYKGILKDPSRAVFNGKIVVQKNAQKTDAVQLNKNLLLSKECWVHTKPELQILANDVKCKHGATVGQLEDEKIFYLRSRGIPLLQAKQILVEAFANEIIDEVPSLVRPILADILNQHLKDFF